MKQRWGERLVRLREDRGSWLRHLWTIPTGYLVFLLFWLLFSMELYGHEGPGSYFEFGAVCVSKFWFVALVFLCRQLLFPESRSRVGFRWLFALLLVVFGGVELSKISRGSASWLYGLCAAGDGLCWSVALALFTENLGMVYRFWILWRPSLNEHEAFQLRFQRDLLRHGLVWTAGLSLAYYYLVNFYLVDSVRYSWITAAVNLLMAVGFFSLYCIKIRCWSETELRTLEREIRPYLDWQPTFTEGDNGAVAVIGAKLNYLWLVRNCWERLKWPVVSFRIYLAYLGLIALPFAFPRIFGIVIEVSSFQ